MENSSVPAHESNEWLKPPAPEQDVVSGPRTARPRGTALKAASLLAIGLIAGAAVALAVGHQSEPAKAAAAGSTSNGLPRIGVPDDPNGPAVNGAPGGGPGGGISGEQRIQGTLMAIRTSTITIRSASGTATYHVTSATEIIKNGAPATLADLKVGDPVFVHVYPSSSRTLLVERIFAGTLPGIGNGGPDGGWRGGSADDGRAGSNTGSVPGTST